MSDFYSRPEYFQLIPPFGDIVKPFEILAESMPGKHDFLAQVQGFDDWMSFYSWLADLYKALPKIDFSWQEWAVVFDAWWGLKLSPLCRNYQKFLVLIVNDDRYLGLSQKVFGESSRTWKDEFGEHYAPSEAIKNLLEKLKCLNDEKNMINAVALKCIHFWWSKKKESPSWLSAFGEIPSGRYNPKQILKELDLI